MLFRAPAFSVRPRHAVRAHRSSVQSEYRSFVSVLTDSETTSATLH